MRTQLWRLIFVLSLLLMGTICSANAQESAPTGFHWQPFCLDCPHDVFRLDDRSLRFDQQGRPHIAHAADRLYYSWYDGSTWRTETVDGAPGATGRLHYQTGAALFLDEAGRPHLSYFGQDNRSVIYAYRDASGWSTTQIDQTDLLMSGGISIAVDGDGNATIVYTKYGELWIARSSTGVWNTESINDRGWIEEYVSLVLDGNGRPHLSYFQYVGEGGPDLHYTFWDGQLWHDEAVDIGGRTGYGNSLALDDEGWAHISYIEYDYIDAEVRYAHNRGGVWQVETLDSATWWLNTSLALDADGRPSISYGAGEPELRLASYGETGWEIEPIAANAWASTLALDGLEQPHVAYFGWVERGLVYAAKTDDGWETQTLVSQPDVGRNPVMAVDGKGELHVVYEDSANGRLKYVRGLSAPTAPADEIDTVIDHIGASGGYANLALDSDGQPHVSYVVGAIDELRYARLIDSDWVTATVASGATLGQHSALTLDAAAGL